MSSEDISIQLEKRDTIGKQVRQLRQTGVVPVVVHDHGKDSIHASSQLVPLEKVIKSAGRHHPVEIKVGSDARLALIRDIDYDPRKNRVRHVVFQSIRRDEKTHAEIPVEIKGEIPAEKASLMVLRQLDTVEVEALPSDLPESLSVDGAKLAEVGDTITVADLEVPANVLILNDMSQALAMVEMPRDQVAEADAAAESLAEDAEQSALPDTTEESSDGSAEEATESATKETTAETDKSDDA